MQVRINAPVLENKLRRLAFNRRTSVPREVTRLLLVALAVERKAKSLRQ